MCQEYWVHFAVKSSPDVCSKVVHRADEVVVSHEHIREEDTEDDREDPRANEALYCLLWGQLNELSASESYTTKVCEDIVANDKGNWQKEPDHPFEDVVHNKMRLDDDKIERHMCPCKLGELESVVAGLKGCDEENETYRAGQHSTTMVVTNLLTNNVKSEADKSVMSREWLKNLVHQYNMLEIIYDALAVKKVHRRR